MNTVSWFLYIADVIQNIQDIFVATAGVSGCLIALACLIQAINNSDTGRPSTTPWYYYLRFIWITILCAILAAIVPKKDTMYMIAASETGGMIIQNEQSKVMFDKIGKIINKKLDEALSDKKD